ncbi:hypothetical protein ACET3X_008800 [Alternaria dauci]|uniref:Glycoside hydrolase family 5 protein n=1 Tax=Alternaria dauci TaxID=48095 RepID=A0ABR3U726_9PLEO
MMLHALLTILISLTSWPTPASASLRITANHHSFAGVNYPQLQFFTPSHRDASIREIVKSGARVIRLFIRPDAQHPDPEGELGGFDKSLLDQFDDTLAAIHHLSKGQVKVIIAPHDAHALRGSNDVPCDAYCQKLGGAFLDFYSSDEYRDLYKTRLEVFFKHYPSRNFDGRPWGSLSEVILGVDLQNQPFSGISPIPSGESWLCDIASFLKFSVGLEDAGIAVISGGVSGPQSVAGTENFPDSVFECSAIDVIGIHGYFDKTAERTAGTPWADMFVPGNTLTGRAMGKGKKGKESKLLLVEEWAYVHNPDFGLFYKKEAIFDQGNALNYRGIPWIYSHLTTLSEGTTSRINPLHPTYTTWPALTTILTHAATARSNFNWTRYLPPPISIIPPSHDEQTAQHLSAMLTGSLTQEWKLLPRGLSNVTSVRLNPYIIQQSTCTFGCLGHLCDVADGCAPELVCKNSVCRSYSETQQPGGVGARCDSKAVCQAHLRCGGQGVCEACVARRSIQPDDDNEERKERKRTIDGDETELPTQQQWDRVVLLNDPNGSCYTDSLPHLFAIARLSSSSASTPSLNTCLPPAHHPSPCTSPHHCSANEYCSWGTCVPCLSTDTCLGSPCRSNAACKTGFCNDYGRCDYVPDAAKKKKGSGPGGARGKRNTRIPGVPRGHERGPARVRDEAMRIEIPGEKVVETGGSGATATATA